MLVTLLLLLLVLLFFFHYFVCTLAKQEKKLEKQLLLLRKNAIFSQISAIFFLFNIKSNFPFQWKKRKQTKTKTEKKKKHSSYSHFFNCFYMLIIYTYQKYSNVFPRCILSQFCPLSKIDFQILAPSIIRGNAVEVVPGLKYMQMKFNINLKLPQLSKTFA